MNTGKRIFFTQILVALLFFYPVAQYASHSNQKQVVDGLAVYMVVLPAQMLTGASEHSLKNMHSREVNVSDEQQHHIMVSVFRAKTGERLTNLKITVKVETEHYKGPEKALELMALAGSHSYGNYFTVPIGQPYQVSVKVTAEYLPKPVLVVFRHAHV